jgi:hypothetical protein
MSAASSTPASTAALANKFLLAGIAGLVLTVIGLFVDAHGAALSYVVGISYWTAVAVGMLMLVMIHHIFDAGWSTVIRRQFEHGLSAFKWLFILFIPLVISAWAKPGFIWHWMDLSHPLHGGHGTVGDDPLYLKKAAFLSKGMFTGMTVVFFLGWMGLAALLRRNSFNQDKDGDVNWTFKNRQTAAWGIPFNALALTFAAIYWMKSLEYHWFSTMYGVWFFANCMRAALAMGVVITWWLYTRGDYKGIFNTNQLHCLVALAYAFVVFWAYVTFSQYFLIWNANVPEETFWYNLREHGDWLWVGLALLFGHFFVPFLLWLSYRRKSTLGPALKISLWIAVVILVDICYNVLPALRDSHEQPLPFLSLNLVWVLSSVVGVGGICVWSYLKSFGSGEAKLIPIRDPRIVESLTHHDATAPEPAPDRPHWI